MPDFYTPSHPVSQDHLRRFNQKELLEAVYKNLNLGELRVEEYIKSPLRNDTNPRCKWVFDRGTYRFLDFSSNNIHSPVREIWQFVADICQLNYKESIAYLVELAHKENVSVKRVAPVQQPKTKPETLIQYVKIPFTDKALAYWADYKIFKEHLLEDKVYQIDRMYMLRYSKGKQSMLFKPFTKIEAYVYTDFKDNKCKIYIPEPKGFYTNLKYEIGNRKEIENPTSENLYITKSYKDYRVTKNALNFLERSGNVVWLQGESTMPNFEDFLLMEKFKNIFYLTDGDKAGINSGNTLKNLFLKDFYINITVHHPDNGRKDFAQLMKHDGYKAFHRYLI